MLTPILEVTPLPDGHNEGRCNTCHSESNYKLIIGIKHANGGSNAVALCLCWWDLIELQSNIAYELKKSERCINAT